MTLAVVPVASGGLGVTTVAASGLPVRNAARGIAVTQMATGGLPVVDVGGDLFGPPVIPANTGLPVITGTPQVGQTLVTTNGTWSGTTATFTYQWKRGGVNIGGATSNSYLLVTADLAANITVTVTATNPAGSANATSAAVGPVIVAAPVNSVLPVITGSTVQGGVLTTTTGTWSGSPTYAYQWKRGGTNVGTNASTYTTVAGDVGYTITVVVTATNAGGNASATSVAVGPITVIVPGDIVLTWTSDATVLDPIFTLDFVADTGDVMTLELDNNSDFSSLYDSDVNTLDGAEVYAGTITFTGIETLGENTTYYARVKQDRGGVVTYSNTVSKTIADVTGGIVTAFFPLDNATNIPANTVFTATFNETITLGTGHVYLKKTSDNSIVEDWNVATEVGSGAGQVQITGGNVLNLKPTSNLTAGFQGYIVWDAGVVVDAFAHGNNAMSSTTAWSFTAIGGAWTSPLDASTPAVFWVDASNLASITKSGTAPNEFVSQWADLGTGAHNLTEAVANGGPIYSTNVMNSKPGLWFVSGGYLKTVLFSLPQPFMIVAVWRQGIYTPDAYGFVFDGDEASVSAGRPIIAARWNSGNYGIFAGTFADQGIATAINTDYHSRAVFDGAFSSSVRNASSLTSLNPGTNPITGINLGSQQGKSQSYICEMFIIKYLDHADVVANATDDATKAAAYVLAKWGV